MIKGTFLSANLGNYHPKKAQYTYSLADSVLANLIHKKVIKIDPDLGVFQEIWTFTKEVLGDNYYFLGQNDCIAVKKSFGRFISSTFKSHSVRFKKSLGDPIYPDLNDETAVQEQINQLNNSPYDGDPNSKYGIPADFDVTSVIVEENQTSKKIMVVNVHVHSQSKNDLIRAKEIKEWIIEDCITRANELTDGRILIGGDFNSDELRNDNSKSSESMKQIISMPNIKDASVENRETTTNYPFGKKRVDHIFGSSNFKNYKVQQSMMDEDFNKFKRKHPLTCWMYLDHKNVSAEFEFER